ncbi:MAG TPA: DinB family protein [Terriglobia bacterium]|nr:DinB family protein [Terriglobia bacterium]
MESNHKVIQKAVGNALSGEGAHAATGNLFEGLDWKLAGMRPEGAPHTIFDLIAHMTFWQDWAVKWLDGEKPPVPRHAAGSWPKSPAPASTEDWMKAAKAFRSSLAGLEQRARKIDLLAKRGKNTGLRLLHVIASHNSYHGGQVVFLRKMLGAWPPPSGGLNW